MATTEQSIEIKASPKKCYEVIADYESYKEFLPDLKNVIVKNHKGDAAEVTYEISVIKTISYTLKMKGTPHSKVEWSFVKGDIMKDNHGYWELEEIKKGVTKATYHITIELPMLVPGSVTKALIGKNLPEMLNNFKKRIESRK